ncbi:MAG: O-antigen ligase family protein [Tatlockia sp.]|nr:O-antigen ligase family protein [Tatlockia sp.]
MKLLVFLLPFTANISQQVKAIFNLDLFILEPLSVDASIGFIGGLLFIEWFKDTHSNTSQRTNILIGLLISFQALIIITVANAVSRNLYQAASSYSMEGLIYNLINLRHLGVYDDYFPLMDLFVFTTAIILSIRLLSLNFTQKQFLDTILIPLFGATIIILAYALWSKITGIGYHRIDVTDGINSFFPDIHAYGGYALAAYIGALYYLNSNKLKIKLITGSFLLFSAAGVVVSSSRFSIVLLFIISLIYLIIALVKNPQKYSVLLGLTLLLIVGLGSISYWDNRGIIKAFSNLNKASSFAEINTIFSERPEIFRANFLMFSHYPILGIGKGIFFRQSSIYEFSKSSFFAIQNSGENAHNYFLQILVETGIVGLISFGSLFIYQFFYLRNRENTIVTTLILGIFSGNLYGHSLLIPNILLIVFVLLGVTNTSSSEKPLAIKVSKYWRYLILAIAIMITLASCSEIQHSYGKVPFQQRFVCYKSQGEYSDRSTSGLYTSKNKVMGKTLKLNYVIYHPDTTKHPLKVRFDLRQGDRLISQLERVVSSPGQYQDKLDISSLTPGTEFLLQIKTSRCFTPINLGFNADRRRLGIQLNQVSQP